MSAAPPARLGTCVGLLLGFVLSLVAFVVLPPACAETVQGQNATAERSSLPAKPWFFTLGLINSYPNLRVTEQIARTSIDLPFHLVSPWFDKTRTFSDLRDEALIWVPYIGFGKVLSQKWMIFANAGMSGTTTRTKGHSPSVFIVPLRYDVRFRRVNSLAGVGTAFYPWNMPPMFSHASLGERLRAARPFLGAGVNYNHIDATTRVDAGLGLLHPLVKVRQNDLWQSASLALAVGVTVPVSATSVLSITGQYVTFTDEAKDFTGPGINISLRHFFPSPGNGKKPSVPFDQHHL